MNYEPDLDIVSPEPEPLEPVSPEPEIDEALLEDFEVQLDTLIRVTEELFVALSSRPMHWLSMYERGLLARASEALYGGPGEWDEGSNEALSWYQEMMAGGQDEQQ